MSVIIGWARPSLLEILGGGTGPVPTPMTYHYIQVVHVVLIVQSRPSILCSINRGRDSACVSEAGG